MNSKAGPWRLVLAGAVAVACMASCGGSSGGNAPNPPTTPDGSNDANQPSGQIGPDASAAIPDVGIPLDDASGPTSTSDSGNVAEVPPDAGSPSVDGNPGASDGALAAADAATAVADGPAPAADASTGAGDGASTADASTIPPGPDVYKLFPQANSSSSYAIAKTGELWSWGANGSGQLGHAGGMTAAMVAALGTNTAIYSGGEIHAVAVSKDGTVFTFGVNFSGQLGITAATGVFGSNPVPQMVGLPTGVKAVATGGASAGERYSSVMGDDGNIYIWGGNLYGQQANKTNIGSMTANPTVHAVPKPDGVTRWKSFGGGYSHLLAIAQDDQMWSWGDNRQGQLGIGAIGAAPDGVLKAVTKPAGVTGWTVATGGRDFSLALALDGALYAWGANDMGQLAAAGGSQPTPTLINLPAGATGWRKLAGGRDHAAAITTEGKLYAWGNGSGAAPKEVVPPTSATSWLDVSGGVGLVIGVASDGKIYQWNAGGKPAGPMAGLP